ncbi:MAG: hypothetical protein HFH93_15680 [Lachnospiraceae bacterium]|nr:hypothetical protein [Lachnospiraceae bacterium]
MCKMIDQFADKIKGQFSFFDRMIINGYLRPLLSEQTRIGYLYSMGIPLRDFTEYFKDVTDQLIEQIEGSAAELGRPVVYLSSPKDRKEDIAKDFFLSDPVDEGLICALKTLESCRTAKVVGTEGKHFLKSSSSKCLHYYLYYLDREFGFMFVKIQTWFPFNIQVYINGRELMKHVFDANGIAYGCYDNSFTDISDVAKAQELADRFDSTKLCRRLDAFAGSISPFLDTVQKKFGQGYFWCVDQCEFATDIMFKERSFLEDIYPSLVGHAFYDFSCTDVFTFMGRKPDPRFQGEAVSDYKNRPIGCRVKFKLKSNSVKMYDKCSVLRIETTINGPREFKVFGTVRHHDGTESKQWKPMGKSISNLYRYAEVSKACNARFIDALVDIVPVRSVQKEISSVCSGKTVKGKHVPGLNVWSPDVLRIMEAVSDGRYLIGGFRNRDIGKAIFPDMEDAKKRSSKTSRTLRKLRRHGLIKKVPRSRRYQVTQKGWQIMGVLIKLYHKDFPELMAKAA